MTHQNDLVDHRYQPSLRDKVTSLLFTNRNTKRMCTTTHISFVNIKTLICIGNILIILFYFWGQLDVNKCITEIEIEKRFTTKTFFSY